MKDEKWKIKDLRLTDSNWWYTSWAQQFVRRNLKCLMHRITLQLILNASLNQIECIITFLHKVAADGGHRENLSPILVMISLSICTYLPLLHKAKCCSFVPPRCLQHNTGRHLPEEDWCKFFFAPLFRLHTVHCSHSSLQSHSIRHAQHLDWDLKDNCSNEVGKFCTSLLITLPIIQLLCYSDLIDWLMEWMIDWLMEWMTDWLTDWLTDWPTDGLAHWLARLLTETSTREHSSFCKEIRNVWCIALLYNCLLSVNHVE